MNFYASIFADSRIVSTTRYGDAGPGPTGQLMSATFELAGQGMVNTGTPNVGGSVGNTRYSGPEYGGIRDRSDTGGNTIDSNISGM